MKKSFNYLALASCFILGTTLAHADSKTQADANASQGNQQLDGSGSHDNKMDDTGKDPKGKKRSTKMSGDRDHQSVSHGGSGGSQSERTRTGSSRGNSGEAGNAAVKDAAAPGKVLKQDKLKIENRDGAMDPTGSAGKSSSPSGS
ncbi:hypothetical protein [Candidatus Nitrotoga arctica]|uniref:Uncharacterized protein n=1 Tax=Candidatus Nitrotoga arctica TaxID=453162 RepID=A0ABN8ASH3_9PROT|nr:hypothetical protein [Candidatus Nitrotoga arctica]CAG9934084.1 conserved exported protein of unknown function [Candidatus Nitrotoga arctica]